MGCAFHCAPPKHECVGVFDFRPDARTGQYIVEKITDGNGQSFGGSRTHAQRCDFDSYDCCKCDVIFRGRTHSLSISCYCLRVKLINLFVFKHNHWRERIFPQLLSTFINNKRLKQKVCDDKRGVQANLARSIMTIEPGSLGQNRILTGASYKRYDWVGL